jgi:2-methylisocitrate lyase-like PEP mutase family enzyme
MQDVGGRICDAVSPNFPIIGDADDGYGNAMSAKRTVEGYIKAGFAGILIEDQMAPKRCGHTGPRPVCDRETSVARVRAACDARDESLEDIVVFARSDARSSMGLDEALERVKAYVDAGADAVFIDALQSKEEMQRFCDACPDTPKMANMLEGGGMTPICQPRELHAMGFKIVAYPLSMLAVSVKAMETALQGIMFEGYPDEELSADVRGVERRGWNERIFRGVQEVQIRKQLEDAGVIRRATSDEKKDIHTTLVQFLIHITHHSFDLALLLCKHTSSSPSSYSSSLHLLVRPLHFRQHLRHGQS